MNKQGKILLDAAVQRLDANSVQICWQTVENADISVYAGTHPKAIDRSEPVARSKDGCAQVSGLDPDQRYYFELDAGTHRLVTAVRRVHLDGAVNFRDIGGYETTDGHRVKWGRAFRADGLSRLTDRDLVLLDRMGIQRVYDFRTTTEMAGSPDRLFPYLTAPRQCIVGVIDCLTDTYGTAVDYLVGKAGLRPAVIDEMRKHMLVTAPSEIRLFTVPSIMAWGY